MGTYKQHLYYLLSVKSLM